MARKSLLMDGTVHERTLLGVTRPGNANWLRRELSGWCMPVSSERHGEIWLFGHHRVLCHVWGKCTRSHEPSQRDSLLYVRYINCN